MEYTAEQLENEIVSLILGKSTHCRAGNDTGWIAADFPFVPWLQINITPCTPLIIFEPSPGKRISLTRLPKRAEMLLGIVHRPLFEIYKKYLEEAK